MDFGGTLFSPLQKPQVEAYQDPKLSLCYPETSALTSLTTFNIWFWLQFLPTPPVPTHVSL